VQVSDATASSSGVSEAAQIWAEATAARDHEQIAADLSLSRPILQAVLDRSAESFVLLARADDGTAAGFAAVEPTAGEEGSALVSYLGVRPGSWGRGVGELLLREVASRLTASGYRRVELMVYVDNQRAVQLYERVGWVRRGPPTPHPRTGKPEQRYELRLTPVSADPPVRRAARVVLLDPDDRVLLMRYDDGPPNGRHWTTPGGGAEAGEDYPAAALRELAEETGWTDIELRDEVLSRVFEMEYAGQMVRQDERMYLARTQQPQREIRGVEAMHAADGIAAWRWWTLPELESTTEDIWPRGLAAMISGWLRSG
jgi:ADP-ribose pyrophosphatase YjhB (NUDIX family)/GNAT superfamily N-acetyltransferase